MKRYLISRHGVNAQLGFWFLFVTSSAASSLAQQLHRVNELSYGPCHASLKDGRLRIGNAHVERTWVWKNGYFFPESLRAMPEGMEWLTTGRVAAAPVAPVSTAGTDIQMSAGYGVFSVVEAPSLRVEVEVRGVPGLHYDFQIFPEAAGIRMWTEQAPLTAASTNNGWSSAKLLAAIRPDTLDHLFLRNSHLRLTQATLRDRTDQHNELLFENEWLMQANEAPLELQGNLFDLEDTLTGAGLVMLKEAPQPEMRQVPTTSDATIKLANRVPGAEETEPGDVYDLSFHGHGFEGSGKGYPYVLLAYSGGTMGRIAALHLYQRQIHTYQQERDGLLLSNTWGDRSKDARIDEDFLHREIDAAVKLGVEVVEVDDGWQSGRTINAAKAGGIWNGYWESDPNFWQPHPERLPHGLPDLVEYAHARGIKLGLWFAPDSAADFQSWKRDAEQVSSWFLKTKVDGFKLDSVKLGSKKAEVNYFAELDQIQKETDGKVLLDLDVTAETRQGYFGKIAAGSLFVENRYTDWHGYWPHQTLRNLWKLSRWIDPLRLRVEFLNSGRNLSLYGQDPLAPEQYPSSTLFATTLMASPLAWFETTGLSDAYIADAAPLIVRWKEERASMQMGTVIPIGDVPDGTTWTGFVSKRESGRGGYLLLFRERNASADWNIPADIFKNEPYLISVLGGRGTVSATEGTLRAHIDFPLGFVWVKLDPVAP